MSRKKKDKQARKNTKTKLNFVKTVCRKSCRLCDVNKADVTGGHPSDLFCYDYMYTAQPKTFLNNILPKTQQLGFWAHDVSTETPTNDEIQEFSSIFCMHGICKAAEFDVGICNNIELCIGLFRDFVVSDCGVDETEEYEQTTPDEKEFMSKNWDGVSSDYWKQFNKRPKVDNKCKKRGKNKAKKKGSKANRNRKPGKAAAQNEYGTWGNNRKNNNDNSNWSQKPTVTIFSNMNEEQLKNIYGDNENNDTKQNTLEAGA